MKPLRRRVEGDNARAIGGKVVGHGDVDRSLVGGRIPNALDGRAVGNRFQGYPMRGRRPNATIQVHAGASRAAMPVAERWLSSKHYDAH